MPTHGLVPSLDLCCFTISVLLVSIHVSPFFPLADRNNRVVTKVRTEVEGFVVRVFVSVTIAYDPSPTDRLLFSQA